MRTLLHMPLDPASRLVRMALFEKGLVTNLIETRPWEDEGGLAAKNPAGTIPVLIDEPPSGGELIVSPAMAIIEYIDEAYARPPIMPGASAGRAEIRRLCSWFNTKFEDEVTSLIVRERIDKRLMRRGQPDFELIKFGKEALAWHFDYVNWLLGQRTWLAGESFSAADLAAAAQISSLDYIDAAPWNDFPNIKEWYARMKSRPSMRPILKDRLDGMPPPSHYDDPDF